MKYFKTYQLALGLYKQGKRLEIKGELKDQFERASLSVVLNLAEGSAKIGRDRKRFFTIAMGSLREVQACMDVIDHDAMSAKADEVAASLYRLLQNPGSGF